MRRTHSETGKPTLEETTYYPSTAAGSGRVVGSSGEHARIEDVTGVDDDGEKVREQEEEQAKRDREYEERMEDEYAKREGGA